MIPVLYESNEQEYLTNGIGRLSSAVSCTVTEDSNGRLTMDYGVIGMVAAVSVSRKVQEQQREIDDLKRKMEILMNEVEQLKKM